MRFLLPQGIGDSVWALHKIQSVAKYYGAVGIEVYLNCAEESEVENRALDFVKRFKFVNHSGMLPGFPIHPKKPVDELGRYNYIPTGWTKYGGEDLYVMIPNGHLERGFRLEWWLPQHEINWDIMKDFSITDEERKPVKEIKDQIGDYAVFYIGPLRGNTEEGHNRGPLWKPEDWLELGKRIHAEFGLSILVVGAPYDELYYQVYIEPFIDRAYWYNLIGQTNVGALYALTQGSKFVISYQSGVGIVSSYLGVPVGIFWRPKGDSINPEIYLSFEEDMASAWVRPDVLDSGNHLPLIYGRHGVSYIMEAIKERRWHDHKSLL
jgi:hypothetical protein